MTTVPILQGIYIDESADFYQSYPFNLEPQLVDSGISKGYLRSAPGTTGLASAFGIGPDRGSVNWNGVCYRVMGNRLVSIVDDQIVILGTIEIAGTEPVAMDYSFDLLGIVGGGNLYYWDLTTLTQVTDPDLGTPIDMLWIDGYFMMTDGTYIIVTDLDDPYSIDPLKYGSSEDDPDPIIGLTKVRGEVYALNLYTIENFHNVGGTGFPFERNSGGLIGRGSVATKAKAYISQTFAFVGQGRNERPSVYLAGYGQTNSISTPQIDKLLQGLTSDELAAIQMESRVENNQERLIVHLPDRTAIYIAQVSQAAQTPVWYYIAGGVNADQPYPLRNLCMADGRWIGGSIVDLGSFGFVGVLDDTVSTYFDNIVGWRFDAGLIYNSARGGIVRSLELVGAPGRGPFGVDPTIFMSLTQDGQTFGQEQAIAAGGFGERAKRLQWRPKVHFWNYLGIRFRGANEGIVSFATLEADIEGLGV